MTKLDKNSPEYLLKWQSLLLPGENKALVLSKKQLINKTREQLVSDNEGIKYAKKVLKNTFDTDEFFKYFYYLTDRVTHIKELSKFYNLPNKTAMDIAVRDIDSKKDEAVKNFLTRSFDSAKAKYVETEDKSVIEEWHKSVLPYKEKMNEENSNYVEELMSQI